MNEGSVIKLNNDIFKDSESLVDAFGDLGYPGILRHAVFEVVKKVSDARGDGVMVTITNAEKMKSFIPGAKNVKSEGEWYLLLKDVVRANTKVTLEYKILS